MKEDPSDLSIRGLEQLKEYDDIFQDMTKRDYVDTKQDLVSAIISFDS
jgi:hypothetical protein